MSVRQRYRLLDSLGDLKVRDLVAGAAARVRGFRFPIQNRYATEERGLVGHGGGWFGHSHSSTFSHEAATLP